MNRKFMSAVPSQGKTTKEGRTQNSEKVGL